MAPASGLHRTARRPGRRAAVAGGVVVGGIVMVCVASLPWTLPAYDAAQLSRARVPPCPSAWLGTDLLGRSLAARTLLGGVVSLGVGTAAALMSMVIGVTYGAAAGWLGGRMDQAMMRVVDVLYGLPYVLLVILLKMMLDGVLLRGWGWPAAWANVTVLLLAIGGVSWLTMARVVRGQVLSLRQQPFVEAARALGVPGWRIATHHLLPNLLGVIVAYATLTIPQAILQESFLSFLGIGIERPLPSWGNLAADGVAAVNTIESFWWMLAFPCGMLTAMLLALNALGDGLRELLDPRTVGRG